MRRLTATLAALLIAGSLAAATASARADSASFPDGTSNRGSMDIHRVRVTNEDRLTIRVVVDDLQRRAGQGSVAVWLDKDPGRPGAEYAIFSGLWDSDWQIARASGWRTVGSGPLHCPVGQRLLFDRDTIVFTTGRACLGRFGKVRVSVTTRGRNGGMVDHSPRYHVFHPWVRRS